MRKIEIPKPKNKLEEFCFPTLVKVAEMKNERGIKLTIYKTSGIVDIPKEMLDYEKDTLDMYYIPHRAMTRTGNIDLGTCDALVVRKWGAKECETVFSAILVRPFSEIDKAIYEEMMRQTFNKPKEKSSPSCPENWTLQPQVQQNRLFNPFLTARERTF